MSTTATTGNGHEGFTLSTDDQALLVRFGRGQRWLRAVLCTLARRGGHISETDPERARHIVDELSRSPLYRGGQFLFDLLELEDFMVDGEPPPPMPTLLDETALRRIGQALRRLRSAVGTTAVTLAEQLGDNTESVRGGETSLERRRRRKEGLAALDLACADRPIAAHIYLYADVAVGIIASLNPPHEQVDQSESKPSGPGRDRSATEGSAWTWWWPIGR